MAIVAKYQEADWEKLPDGSYPAVISRVFDLGFQNEEYQGEAKIARKIVIAYETAEKMKKEKNAGKPFVFFKEYNLSLADNSNLRKDLEKVGKKFTPQELNPKIGWDIEKAIGKGCLVSLTTNPATGKQKVSSIAMPINGMAKVAVTMNWDVPKWIAEKQAKQVADPNMQTAPVYQPKSAEEVVSNAFSDGSPLPQEPADGEW